MSTSKGITPFLTVSYWELLYTAIQYSPTHRVCYDALPLVLEVSCKERRHDARGGASKDDIIVH